MIQVLNWKRKRKHLRWWLLLHIHLLDSKCSGVGTMLLLTVLWDSGYIIRICPKIRIIYHYFGHKFFPTHQYIYFFKLQNSPVLFTETVIPLIFRNYSFFPNCYQLTFQLWTPHWSPQHLLEPRTGGQFPSSAVTVINKLVCTFPSALKIM